MKRRRPGALVFDLGKVLIDFSVEKACAQVGLATGVSPSGVYSFLFDDGLEDRFEAGEFPFSELHKKFEKRFQVSVDAGILRLAAADIFSPIESSIQILNSLKTKYSPEVPLVLLSNTNEIHWSHIENTWQISQFFDHLVLSFEVKSLKPEEMIYRDVTRKTGLLPEACFFVDDVPANVIGAKNVGFDAVLFEGEMKLRSDLIERGFLL